MQTPGTSPAERAIRPPTEEAAPIPSVLRVRCARRDEMKRGDGDSHRRDNFNVGRSGFQAIRLFVVHWLFWSGHEFEGYCGRKRFSSPAFIPLVPTIGCSFQRNAG